MGTPVTAADVRKNTNVWHDDNPCFITSVKKVNNGGITIQWTEEVLGREALFTGSFNPNAFFGETITA